MDTIFAVVAQKHCIDSSVLIVLQPWHTTSGHPVRIACARNATWGCHGHFMGLESHGQPGMPVGSSFWETAHHIPQVLSTVQCWRHWWPVTHWTSTAALVGLDDSRAPAPVNLGRSCHRSRGSSPDANLDGVSCSSRVPLTRTLSWGILWDMSQQQHQPVFATGPIATAKGNHVGYLKSSQVPRASKLTGKHRADKRSTKKWTCQGLSRFILMHRFGQYTTTADTVASASYSIHHQ